MTASRFWFFRILCGYSILFLPLPSVCLKRRVLFFPAHRSNP